MAERGADVGRLDGCGFPALRLGRDESESPENLASLAGSGQEVQLERALALMSELCKANPCCGNHYGNCEVPMPQDLSGFWSLNSEEQKVRVLREREAQESRRAK